MLKWLRSNEPGELALPAIVIGELQHGAEMTRKQDPGKAEEIDRWTDRIIRVWRIVEMDARIAREWARLMGRRDRTRFEDAMIAATARIHGLVVVTRNTKDFEGFEVEVLNPFLYAQGKLD